MLPGRLLCFVVTTTLCLAFSRVRCSCDRQRFELSSSGKPLLKRPTLHSFKTLLSLDGGALRGTATAMVLIEIEHSIKQYLLDEKACLSEDLGIASVDDFDINLADYFDCMTGVSAGSWAAMYLATRGGQGASRAVLDDPVIIEKYGKIPTGGAEGLRVFFNEYASTIYPLQTIDFSAGRPFDPMNSLAPGSTSPLFALDGLEQSLEAFLGNTTLADADTSLLVPAVDLGTGLTIYFVQNAFRNPPVTSLATLVPRMGPRILPQRNERLHPDITFDEGKDYYLKDVGTASGAIIVGHPAKQMTQVGNGTVEFHLVDGAVTEHITDMFGALFVSSEARLFDLTKIAILSIGTSRPMVDLTSLRNAGTTQWAQNVNFLTLLSNGGVNLLSALMDYLYYADPTAKPFAYLRINGEEPMLVQPGAGPSIFDPSNVSVFEELGRRVATAHRQAIDMFVRDFIFG